MSNKLVNKVGILSFPTAVNHGAYLQVFALKVQLEEYGSEVIVLNYRNRTHYLNELRSLLIKKNIRSIFINIKRLMKFHKAQKRFHLKSMVTDVKKLEIEGLDIVSVGADIVWNYSTPFVGHDPIYFGDGIDKPRLIAYAPSMGDSSKESIPEYVKIGSKKFSHIGVRDENTQMILENCQIDSDLVLDPTMLINWNDWEVDTYKFEFEYILIYAFSLTKEDIRNIKIFAHNNNIKIISIGFNVSYEWCDFNLMVIDPLEFLAIYGKAKYVFTSTFHGVLFAINYQKQFVLRNNKTVAKKLSSILNKLNLENRELGENDFTDIISQKIDYEKVTPKLDALVTSSKLYLKRALDNA